MILKGRIVQYLFLYFIYSLLLFTTTVTAPLSYQAVDSIVHPLLIPTLPSLITAIPATATTPTTIATISLSIRSPHADAIPATITLILDHPPIQHC